MSLSQEFYKGPLEARSNTRAFTPVRTECLIPDCSQEAVLVPALRTGSHWKYEAPSKDVC